jgi:serine/threonine protein kinase
VTDILDLIRSSLPAEYSLGRQLGSGGQGAVFFGEKGGKPVALKLFDGAQLERIKREIDLLNSVKCDYLVRLLDFHVLEPKPSVHVPMAVYEFIDGGDLRAVIKSKDVITETALTDIGRQIGEAVQALWSQRIVHRDIKPDNIVFDASRKRYVLVDVGVAQHLNLTTITGAAGQPGTNGYRSPEQCGGRRRLTIHSDVFSLGVSLFEVATKDHPWDRNQSVMGRVRPKQILDHRKNLERRMALLIHQMMSYRPSSRPADPGARFGQLAQGR